MSDLERAINRLEASRRARWALLASAGATLALYALPYPWDRYLAYPLMLVSTLAHELGHGMAGLLVGGTFESFALHADGSGVARVSGYSGRLAGALVSAGGLLGPAVAAAACFLLGRWRRPSRAAFLVAGALLVVAEVLVVRNLFGWAFVGVLAAACLVVGSRLSGASCQLALLFVAVQLSLSVFSRGDYLFAREARTGSGTMPSDVANMASALFLPYWVWGLLCGGLSLAILAAGLWLYLRPPRVGGISPRGT